MIIKARFTDEQISIEELEQNKKKLNIILYQSAYGKVKKITSNGILSSNIFEKPLRFSLCGKREESWLDKKNAKILCNKDKNTDA